MYKLQKDAGKRKLSALEKVIMKKLLDSKKNLWMLEETIR